ncbi:carbon monoxide dehydrogenase subunit G [Streptomyces sp. SAI-135]|uniref:SRPBCC domain-containing protein n=1 Tax=unclassified Streptomyces TaxID=2593676 RepID=UPI002473A5F7|nr:MULTISPECIES: SRPBCC domain-containing protein [unclassified Streptomyces]MDH6517617.1 carbon monoxide dehydrogenase subunit G [Streptomyces sp. SAI-090]MDH6618294.1 carbon monoxide dehydrogenase subunit G [Streptomyces sp. SAI-135]
MEHEVFVPVPVERLRETLGDPVRVARAVPGLQQDAGADPVAGRLKVRVGSHSITYRGAVGVSARDDGSYAVEGEGAETRGTGSVKLALTVRLRGTDGGTTLVFEGTATADGRVTELPQDAVGAAVVRLLNRFAESLGETKEEPETTEPSGTPKATEPSGTPEAAEPSGAPEAAEPSGAPGVAEASEIAEESREAPGTPEAAETPEPAEPPDETREAPGEAEAFPDEAPAPLVEDLTEPTGPPAEAAHARRTMIGRSAEEVDHAPPRGRYAPVPAPQTATSGVPLRWAAPAAAVALASAIVVGRALRKRR